MIKNEKSATVTVEYFALFRSLARKSSETLAFEEVPGSASDLFEEVRTRYAFPLGRESVQVAVNDEFASWDVALRPGDRIAFLPPASGG